MSFPSMNLAKLFETQKVLRDRINYQGEDRFEKLVLALLVELGECANEWRGFKFWSKDQEPRKELDYYCEKCEGLGNEHGHDGTGGYFHKTCSDCKGKGFITKKPLLEEYVDGLHFLIELGIEFKVNPKTLSMLLTENKRIGSMQQHFAYIYNRVSHFLDSGYEQKGRELKYVFTLNAYIGLGKRLGFTWDQIEQAYFEKNAVNHQRQEDGY